MRALFLTQLSKADRDCVSRGPGTTFSGEFGVLRTDYLSPKVGLLSQKHSTKKSKAESQVVFISIVCLFLSNY